MYKHAPVAVPDIPGKITFRRQGAYIYVHLELQRTYHADKKYNTVKRTVIGKLVDENDRTKMYPNENFAEIFPNVPLADLEPPPSRSASLKAGTHIVFRRIVMDHRLAELILEIFGPKGAFIMDLASYMIITEDNSGQHYPDYAWEHPLFTPQMRVLSDSTVSRRLSEIKEDQILSFLDRWNKNQDHRQKIFISYDSTNKNCQAGDIDFAEFGYAKDDRGVPIVNYSVAFDKTNRIPLFYELYPGSVNDVSQLKYLIDKVKDYGYHNVGLILDRGYFSRKNIEYMDEKQLSFLMMVKGCKPLVSELIVENSGTFENDHSAKIPGTFVHARTIEHKLYDNDGKKRYFHLCFSPLKKAQEYARLYHDIERMAAELKKLEGREFEVSPAYSEFFNCHYDETEKGKKIFLYAQENHEAISRAVNLCGYFCLISSDKMTAEEAYTLYRGRDVSEKLFRTDKSFLGSRSLRVHSSESMSAKFFVGFIALIIRNRFYNLLKDEMRRLKIRKNYMTVPAAIRELEKITISRRNGSLYRLDYALTKTQKTILQSFGLNQEDLIAEAGLIARQLNELNDEVSACEDKEVGEDKEDDEQNQDYDLD